MKIRNQIENKIKNQFHPAHVEVMNESHMHSVPPGSETHFKVVIVSENFNGKTLVGRHKEVNRLLSEELAGEVHALALHTYTPEEWSSKAQAPDSPDCKGGSKAE